MKELSDIAWNVDEPTYRADPALSHSTLARYEENGRFSSLPTLFDKLTTSSLIFGSMVDTLLTGSEEEFTNLFMVVEDPNISDTLKDITHRLIELYPDSDFDSIPDAVLAEIGKEKDFWANDKYVVNRVKQIRQNCKTYFSVLKLSQGKTIVTSTDVEDARRCADVLRTSPKTSRLFETNDPFNPDIRRYYQLKFKCTDPQTGVHYRSMLDLVIVDYANKIIWPYDLKTTSFNEWEFPKAIVKYKYHDQARLYWRNLRQNLDADEYFKDFKLMDFRFICINRTNCKPLVWKFEKTQTVGTITFKTKSGYTYNWRDPYEIGKELDYYLNNQCEFPAEITNDNDIIKYLEEN